MSLPAVCIAGRGRMLLHVRRQAAEEGAAAQVVEDDWRLAAAGVNIAGTRTSSPSRCPMMESVAGSFLVFRLMPFVLGGLASRTSRYASATPGPSQPRPSVTWRMIARYFRTSIDRVL